MVLCFICSEVTSGADPVGWWSFDSVDKADVVEKVSGAKDVIEGSYTKVAGVEGAAVRLDGYTSCIIRKADKAPKLGGVFSVEAWVALGAYPWNWCSLVSHKDETGRGYSLEIGPRGEVNLELLVDGKSYVCPSARDAIPLRKWMHVAGTFSADKGLAVFVNGRKAGSAGIVGRPEFARKADIRIGANHVPVKPSNIHRPHGTLPGWFSIDGIIDEVKIYNTALAEPEVLAAFKAIELKEEPDLPVRRMPSGPAEPGRFGAYYCKLSYYKEWDDLWAVDEDPDVVVRFDGSATRLVFWRGSRYSAAWVSENNLWMADQSVEAWGVGDNDKEGCFEHMQDRKCRYSHVRVIESSDARVVVHWRYAPVSAHNNLWRVNPKTGRACWVDEYYYIYPDQLGIRKPTWKTGTLGHPRQFQESLPFTHPGQYQDDVVNLQFATVGNLKGETQVLEFKENPAKKKEGLPKNLVIQQYNFKSRHKPSIIFEPGNRMHYVTDRRMGSAKLRVPGSCNHWPVGQAACDGRTSQMPDRPTHFLGFPISYPPVHEKDGRSWWNGLYGMTTKTVKELAVVGRSWAHAPELKVLTSTVIVGEGYDMSQRAYQLACKIGTGKQALEFELKGSEASPVYNPAFVIKNWGEGRPDVYINGRRVNIGKKVRIGYRRRLEGTHLVLWLALESFEGVKIKLH